MAKLNISEADSNEIEQNVANLESEFTKHCAKDENKKSILLAKYLLECMSLWPSRKSTVTLILNYMTFTSLLVMLFSVLYYIFLYVKNITDFAFVSITTTTSFTGVIRISTLIFKAKVTNEILVLFWKEFWPADISDSRLKKSMVFQMNIIKYYTYVYASSAIFSTALFLTSSLIAGNGELPILSAYPFDYKKLPYYELLTVWYYFNNYLVVTLYFSFDYLFMVIVINVILQFQILQFAIKHIYEKNTMEGIKVRRFFYAKLDLSKRLHAGRSLEMSFLTKCIDHHQMVLDVCGKVEDVFSLPILMTLFFSTMGLCVSSLAVNIESADVPRLVLFAGIQLIQLFMYCYLGSELVHTSTNLIDTAFHCGFNNTYDREFWKSLVILMRQCKEPQCLTASGIATLDFKTFIGVLQLAFSFYTLLESFVKQS